MDKDYFSSFESMNLTGLGRSVNANEPAYAGCDFHVVLFSAFQG